MKNQVVKEFGLILRPINTSDFSTLKKFFSHPKTMKHLQYIAKNFKNVSYKKWKKVYDDRKQKRKKGELLNFLVVNQKTNEPMGSCEILNIKKDHRRAEVGIILHYPYCKKGIGLSCLYLCLNIGFNKLKLHRIQFETLAKNIPAKKLLRSAGISLESTMKESQYENGKYIDSSIYVVFQKQWPKVKKTLLNKIKSKWM